MPRNTIKQGNSWPLCCLSFASIIISLIFFIIVLLPLTTYFDFVEESCHVESVTYPLNIPSPTNLNNWRKCSCGHSCSAQTPCVNVIVNIDNHSYAANMDSSWSLTGYRNDICTFYNSSCPSGKNILSLYQYMEWAKEIADNYNSNTTLRCFKDKNYVYLSNEIPLGTVISTSVSFTIIIIATIVLYRQNKGC